MNARLTPEEFYDSLSRIESIDQRIESLSTSNYDLYLDYQPEAILTLFYNEITNERQSDQIASIFMRKLGDTIICREASCCENEFITIMDAIRAYYRWDDPESPKYIIRSFTKFKFKYANECDEITLRHKYSDDPEYQNTNLIKFREKKTAGKKRKHIFDEHIMGKIAKLKI